MGAFLPWRMSREMERMSRMFDRMFREWPWPIETEEERAHLSAPVECYVQNNDLVIRADVPGVEPKDIEISLLGNVLTIKGERKAKREIKEHEYLRREIAYGGLERHIPVPEGVQADRIKAGFKNGVVEITIPLAKEVTAKKIPVVESK
jgi:HSP20 family protein